MLLEISQIRFMVDRGEGWVMEEQGEGSQKEQISSYKINKYWGYKVQYLDNG